MSQIYQPASLPHDDRRRSGEVLRRTLRRLAPSTCPTTVREESRISLLENQGPLRATNIVCDIVGFGRRDALAQFHARQAMYRTLRDSIDESGMPQPGWVGDRGDGAMLVLTSKIPTQRHIDIFLLSLVAGLRRHNRTASNDTRIRLRMAINCGMVRLDQEGLGGKVLVTLCRMLDAQAFRDVVASTDAVLTVIVPESFFADEIEPGWGILDPAAYRSLTIVNKETTANTRYQILWPPPTPVSTSVA